MSSCCRNMLWYGEMTLSYVYHHGVHDWCTLIRVSHSSRERTRGDPFLKKALQKRTTQNCYFVTFPVALRCSDWEDVWVLYGEQKSLTSLEEIDRRWFQIHLNVACEFQYQCRVLSDAPEEDANRRFILESCTNLVSCHFVFHIYFAELGISDRLRWQWYSL